MKLWTVVVSHMYFQPEPRPVSSTPAGIALDRWSQFEGDSIQSVSVVGCINPWWGRGLMRVPVRDSGDKKCTCGNARCLVQIGMERIALMSPRSRSISMCCSTPDVSAASAATVPET